MEVIISAGKLSVCFWQPLQKGKHISLCKDSIWLNVHILHLVVCGWVFSTQDRKSQLRVAESSTDSAAQCRKTSSGCNRYRHFKTQEWAWFFHQKGTFSMILRCPQMGFDPNWIPLDVIPSPSTPQGSSGSPALAPLCRTVATCDSHHRLSVMRGLRWHHLYLLKKHVFFYVCVLLLSVCVCV